MYWSETEWEICVLAWEESKRKINGLSLVCLDLNLAVLIGLQRFLEQYNVSIVQNKKLTTIIKQTKINLVLKFDYNRQSVYTLDRHLDILIAFDHETTIILACKNVFS